jgi:hypothetical protein
MAKALKAPGQNGPGDVAEVLARLESAASAVGDGYWRGHVVVSAVGPAGRLLGDARAHALLSFLAEDEGARAQALGALAEGLQRRGDSDDARRALADAEALLRDGSVDGERGTLGWCAVARARHCLGEAAACDAALDAARACAKREKSNPTQPWPHLAMALADTGRADALLAQLRKLPARESLSFDIEKAARRTIARAVTDGDAETFGQYLVRLQDHNGYVLAMGLREGAAGAVRAGRGEALEAIVGRFAAHPSYGGSTGAEAARQAAYGGDLALALRLARVTRDRYPHHDPELAYALTDLGDAAAGEAILVSCKNVSGPRPGATVEELVPYLRTLHARDPAVAREAFVAQEAAAQATAPGIAQALHLAGLGLAQVAVGEAAYGAALLTQAATVIVNVPKSSGGYARGEAVKQIGARAAAAGSWLAALTLARKSTSKYEKQVIARGLAAMYARAGDFPGALAAAALAPNDPLHAAMGLCDVLAEAAGVERPYHNYA